jgi:hypothetical protein
MDEKYLIWVPCIAIAVEAAKKLPWVNGYKEIYSLISVGLGMVVAVSLGGTALDGMVLGLTASGGYSMVKKASEK